MPIRISIRKPLKIGKKYISPQQKTIQKKQKIIELIDSSPLAKSPFKNHLRKFKVNLSTLGLEEAIRKLVIATEDYPNFKKPENKKFVEELNCLVSKILAIEREN